MREKLCFQKKIIELISEKWRLYVEEEKENKEA